MKIHFTAICGVGMAPLAVLLEHAGHEVTGSDKAALPPMSLALADAGIEVIEGFDAANLDPPPDLVVIGNSVVKDNPEAVAATQRGLETASFPSTVARFFLDGHRSLVVTGTHGKTTTTGMLARCLQLAGLDPGYLVGGLVKDLGRLADSGSGEFFVIEGDEYDSAYFDKRPKFLHYQPSAAIATSLEFDHADIYRDLDHVKSAFRDFAALLPAGSPFLCCGDYPDLMAAVSGAGDGKVITYGSGADCDWTATAVSPSEQGIAADIVFKGRREDSLSLALSGEMNLANALAVYGLCRELGIDTAAVREALASFEGVARRQEIVAEVAGVTVIDDFAHHPTAIAATLDALRARFPGRALKAVFEPRSNTSRRNVFQKRFPEALASADAVVISAVYQKENDPLSADELLSTDRVLEDLSALGVSCWSADGPDAILERLTGEVVSGDVVVCMSNGAFGDLPRRLVAALRG